MAVQQVQDARAPTLSASGLRARAGAYVGLASALLAWAVAAGLLLANRTLAPYVDEADNLLGGRLMAAHGWRLYADYFSHHMPLPYVVAAVFTWLGAHDLLGYRAAFAALLSLVMLYAVLRFRRELGTPFVCVLAVTMGLMFPMFSGHLLVADHFLALAVMLVALLLLARRPPWDLGEQALVAACLFLAVQSTLIAVYSFLLVGVYYAAYRVVDWRRADGGVHWRDEARFAALCVAPHALVLMLLAVVGLLPEWFDQAVRFNQVYYARYELGSDPLSIVGQAVPAFLDDVRTYLRPSGLREVETFFLVSNLAAVALVWRTRGLGLAATYLGLAVLGRLRGNSGYHGLPYMAMTCVSAALLASAASASLASLFRDARQRPAPARLLLGGAAALYLGATLLFYRDAAGFDRRLPRGQELDSPYADAVAAMTRPDDPVWAAPDEPYVSLAANRLPASRYWFLHPWLADDPEIIPAVLADLRAAQPPVVVFRADKEIPWYFPLPRTREFAAPVYAYLQQAYVAANAQDEVLRDVYLRRDLVDSLRAKLAERGLLTRTSVP